MDPERISDQELDAMLRDIEVPDQLRQQLMDIADEQVGHDLQPASRKRDGHRGVHWRLNTTVLVASLLTMAAVLTWSLWPRAVPIRDPIAKGVELQPSSTPDRHKALDVSARLSSLDASIEHAEQVLHRARSAQIHARIARLRKQSPSVFERREVDSMIIALADQASIPLGGSEKNVERRMARVIERFPGSRGAGIAQEFLNQLDN